MTDPGIKTVAKEEKDKEVLKGLLTDSAVVLAGTVALLYFLGAQREYAYLSVINQGGGWRTMPDSEYLIIKGFNVLTKLGGGWFHEIPRYVVRGLIAGGLAFVLSRKDRDQTNFLKCVWFWLGCAAALWSLSRAASDLGAREVDNARFYEVVFTMKDTWLGERSADESEGVQVRPHATGQKAPPPGTFILALDDGYMYSPAPGKISVLPKEGVARVDFSVKTSPPKIREIGGIIGVMISIISALIVCQGSKLPRFKKRPGEVLFVVSLLVVSILMITSWHLSV